MTDETRDSLINLRALSGGLPRAVLFCVSALAVIACGAGSGGRECPKDVLLITIDTARADRFSYTGSSPVRTVSADRIASEGTAFLEAVAPSPITLVSHASLLTGQNPYVHGVRNNGDFALAPEAVTLAELFSANAWTTAAFIGAAVLDSRYGLDQGFETYDDEITPTDATGMFAYARRSGDEVVGAALQWLGGCSAEHTFVWVHLYDPHAPYEPPEPERSRYPDSPYDGAVAFADRMVGRLLDGYRRLGRYEKTLVVLTADHGESLTEHGENTHGVFIYDATVRIPLVMRGPGIAPGRRIPTPVALIDVMPTILEIAGIPVPATVDGRDLGRLMNNDPGTDGDRAIYVESMLPMLSYGWSPLRGLRTQRWKFIRGAAAELYDLEADPAELEDLASERADVVAKMSKQLADLVSAEGSSAAVSLEVDEAERGRLAALGYLSNATGADVDNEGRNLPDPREQIGDLNRTLAAMNRFADGDEGGAIADLEGLSAENPGNLLAVASLADLLFRVGDYERAADAFGQAVQLAPYNARYNELEGLALERLGRYEEALVAVERALADDPERISSRNLRWRLMAQLGRNDALLTELQKELSEKPSDGMARVLYEQVRHGSKPSQELVQALETALQDLPGDLTVTAALAGAVYGMGDEDRAVSLYRRVLERRPGDLDATLVVGERLLEKGEIDQARTVIEAGVRRNPDRAPMQVLLARLRMATGDYAAAREALVRAYRVAPGWAYTWLAAGELGILEGLPEQAAANLDRAAAAGADDAKFWRRLASANRQLGREAEAVGAEHHLRDLD